MIVKTVSQKKESGIKAAEHLLQTLDAIQEIRFPSNPGAEDFLDEDHLIGMQMIELALTYLLRSARIINQNERLDILGKYSLLVDSPLLKR
jgi:hypothetical protein